MVDRMHFLAFAAQSKGASGVRQYLQGMRCHCSVNSVSLLLSITVSLLSAEHHQQVPSVLQELSATVLLLDDKEEEAGKCSHEPSNDTAVKDFGICMEQLPLRAQREIWSALVSGAAPNEAAAVNLARAFLRVVAQPCRRESDTVCVSLARIVLSRGTCEGENESAQGSTTAFRRRMRRLTLNRVQFPSRLDEDDDVRLVGLQEISSSNAAMQTSSRLYKRHNDEVVDDPWPSKKRPSSFCGGPEQNVRNNTIMPTLSATKLPERPLLTKEMEDRASVLSKLLVQLSRSDADAAVDDVATRAFDMLAEVVNDVHTTYAANEQSFQHLCKLLRMDSTSDEALAQITSALVDSNWSSRYAAIFLETSVLPKIRAADFVISRVLLQTALRFGSAYAGSLRDSLLLPLLVGDKDAMVGPAQAEAITRILRSSDTALTDQLNDFIQKVVTAKEGNNSTPHLFSNEAALLVFQNILNTKPVLSPLTVEKFIGACEAVLERPEGEQQRGSLKFATVIFTLISKYPQQCASHVEILEAIVTQLTSIMAKTTLRLLQKLKNSK